MFELGIRKRVAGHLGRRGLKPSRLVAGVDGGGTGTRAVILDGNKQVVGEGQAGPSNPLRVGIATAATNVREAVDKACSEAAVHRDEIMFATIGLAGVRRKDIHDRAHEQISESLKEIKSIELLTDGEIALYGGTGGHPGLVVIAGTGSICCGRNRQGKNFSAGGWGPIVGDEGGASWIARKALQAVAHASDGRGRKTALTALALNYFKVASAEDLSTAIYAQTMTNDRLAGFGKQVVRAARTGDEVSIGILREAGQELGVAATAVIKKLRMENDRFPVAYVGGVYGAGDLVLVPMEIEIKKIAKQAFLTQPLFPPVIAAAHIAYAHAQGDLALAM